MPGKSKHGIGIFIGSQQCQSGIGIPASFSVRYRWPRISPALPSFAYNHVGEGVKLETMPLNSSWRKLQWTKMNALASLFLYGFSLAM
jgi:hypothetical protein